tara:strand:+ start:30 stop:137 length:108 start_codon:yes stop_codon:yes gene_type:complete
MLRRRIIIDKKVDEPLLTDDHDVMYSGGDEFGGDQ